MITAQPSAGRLI